jgi:hypothetical protein
VDSIKVKPAAAMTQAKSPKMPPKALIVETKPNLKECDGQSGRESVVSDTILTLYSPTP